MELKINRLTKRYKDKLAVDGVSLKLTPGIWGLLGANGAGKTTMMRMVAGILKPTSGGVFYDGLSIDDLGESYRDIFGYLPQTFGFYPEFTVKNYLEYMSALKGIGKKDASRKIESLLQVLALSDVKNKKIRRLSGGMQRRVGIAQALLNDPEILILDEPTSGLDPGERVRFRNILAEFAQERIVLISTHIVSDVENIATRNAVMKDGRIIAAGSTDELVAAMKAAYGVPRCLKAICLNANALSVSPISGANPEGGPRFVIWPKTRYCRAQRRKRRVSRTYTSGFSRKIQEQRRCSDV